MDADPERGEERLRERPRRRPAPRSRARWRARARCGRRRGRTSEQPDEVGVAGTRQVDLLDVGVDRPRVHPLLPVGVVAIRDQHGDRAAERAPVAHAGADLDGVLLDLHPPAAAVAELAPRHVAVERLAVELEPRGQALDDRDEPGAVRFACCREAKRHEPRLSAGLLSPGRTRPGTNRRSRPRPTAR